MKKLLLLFGVCCLFAVPAAAQRPIAATTITSTNTSATSLCVGCAIGSSTATGGIKAGVIDVASVTSAGFIEIANNVPGATTNRLYNNGGTLTWAGSAVAIGGAVGPGTIGKLAKFTGANSIGDSICAESGTTLSCVNTISATSLTGTLTTASQTAITGVGTIGTGVWQGTKVNLAYGGTNADLSGTGGTSQFLRQNSVGGTITVVRPAVSDLSDASNVPLINASSNAYTGKANYATTSSISAVGDLGYNSVSGSYWFSKTGSSYDWSVIAPDTNYVMRVPTGTKNLEVVGVVTGTGFGTNGFKTGGTGFNILQVVNTTIGAGNGSAIYIGNNSQDFRGTIEMLSTTYTPTGYYKADGLAMASNGAGGLGLIARHASGTVGLWTGGDNLRWGVNAAGDWTWGTSSVIVDSAGTPTIASGGGTAPNVFGQDYAFTSNTGSTASTSITFQLGHAFTNFPICTVSSNQAIAPYISGGGTGPPTTVTVTYTSATSAQLYVQCRGR